MEKSLKERVDEINKGDSPKIEKLTKINFVKEGRAATMKNRKSTRIDPKWERKWNVAFDLGSPLIFPLVGTAQRPDIVLWSDEKKKAMFLFE